MLCKHFAKYIQGTVQVREIDTEREREKERASDLMWLMFFNVRRGSASCKIHFHSADAQTRVVPAEDTTTTTRTTQRCAAVGAMMMMMMMKMVMDVPFCNGKYYARLMHYALYTEEKVVWNQPSIIKKSKHDDV